MTHAGDALRIAESAALLVEVIFPEQPPRHHLRKTRTQFHIESKICSIIRSVISRQMSGPSDNRPFTPNSLTVHPRAEYFD